MTKLLTYSQIEKIYGLKKGTMTKMVMKGEFVKPVKVGNRNYFKVEEVEAWINSRQVREVS